MKLTSNPIKYLLYQPNPESDKNPIPFSDSEGVNLALNCYAELEQGDKIRFHSKGWRVLYVFVDGDRGLPAVVVTE